MLSKLFRSESSLLRSVQTAEIVVVLWGRIRALSVVLIGHGVGASVGFTIQVDDQSDPRVRHDFITSIIPSRVSHWRAMKHCTRVCDLKLSLLLLFHAFHLHLCLAQDGAGIAPMFPQAPDNGELLRRHFSHNETRIAIARGSAATRATSGHQFPDRQLEENLHWGLWYDDLQHDLQIFGGRTWHFEDLLDEVNLDVLVMDGEAYRELVDIDYQDFRVPYEPWRPHIQRVRDTSPDERFVEVLVKVRVAGFEILGEGVYCPITGTMHLVGCTRKSEIPSEALAFEAGAPYVWTFADDALNLTDFESESSSWRCREKVDNPFGISEYVISATNFNSSRCQNGVAYFTKSSGVCDTTVTLQYPPLTARWNWERVLNLTVRSTRREDDPLYFNPVERNIFFPYPYHHREFSSIMPSRATMETGIRMILLLLGIACVGLQIRHGRNNEEALPFVSLGMLGIQIANHFSQTAIFKDLQIHRFAAVPDMLAPSALYSNLFSDEGFESTENFNYYITMAFHEYVPYQAMAMTSIFMYVWIFHRVGDRRRIMQLRVRKGKPSANPPPSDRQLVFATLTILCIVGLFGIASYGVDYNIFRFSAIEGLPGAPNGSNLQWMGGRDFGLARAPAYYNDQFVSPKFYELSEAQWGFVNRLTGLVVSLFLVPQLLGNWRWQGQGRPLTAWFYVGLPFLQSLPHDFAIAKHFQLLPIFAWYDPYRNPLYGFYENPTLWWQIGVVLSSAILVVAVHLQFVTSFRPLGQHSTAGVSIDVQTCDEL